MNQMTSIMDRLAPAHAKTVWRLVQAMEAAGTTKAAIIYNHLSASEGKLRGAPFISFE